MNILIRPAGSMGRRKSKLDHSRRSANVKMRSQRLLVDQFRQRYLLPGVVTIDVNARTIFRLQVAGIGAALGAAHAVMKLEWQALPVKLFGHGDDGRDTDSARQQNVPAAPLVDRKKIDRMTDGQQ